MDATPGPAVVRVTGVEPSVDEAIAVIRIDAPPVNALPPEEWERLASLVAECADDPSIRVVVIAGTDRTFCAGADIRMLTEAPAPGEPPARMLRVVADTCHTIAGARPPVVAAITGPAHGGGLELALSCDVRIAHPSATFAASGVNMGLVASVGSLVAAIGPTRARRMLLTGERIDAERAQAWSLVTDIADDPLAEALRLAQVIAAKAPLAVEAAKRMADLVGYVSADDHDAAMVDAFAALAASDDHAEAVRAFLAKEPPTFTRS